MTTEDLRAIIRELNGVASGFKTQRFLDRAQGQHENAEALTAVISHLEAAARALKAVKAR